MKVNGNELRPGNIILYKDRLWMVVKVEHVKPGKGGAIMQVELKDLKEGTKLNDNFRSSEKVERVHLDELDGQFLYPEGDAFIFMDTRTYDQIPINKDFLGDKIPFLRDGMLVKLQSYEGAVISIELPIHVVLIVQDTEPAIKGQTAASSLKPATLENGIRTKVPTFVVPGDKIVVDTRDGTYVRRAES